MAEVQPERLEEASVFDASFAQERLWLLEQIAPGNAPYNIPGALRLEGELDLPALGAALTGIVRRHEALRTTFVEEGGVPVQVVAPPRDVDLPVLDLADLARRDQDARVADEIAQEAAKPFDLVRGPLLRVKLLRLGDREHVALFTMHHIVSDGWSMGVFVRELAALYPAFREGRPAPLPELDIQYADFACWQREWLSGHRLDEQLHYWKEQLAPPLALLELPTDRPRPAVQTFHGASHRFRLPAELTMSLRTLGRQHGATLFMTLLAGFEALLHRLTGQTDLCIGSPIANRNRRELEPLIGFFVNTLVLRTDASGNPGFAKLLDRVRETALGAYAHQDVPFERLVEELQPVRDLSHTPLFQVVFALQNAPRPELRLGQLTLTPISSESATAKFDLTLEASETGDEIDCSMEFNTDLFDLATIERMAGHFTNLLQRAVEDPQQPVGTLEMLSQKERQQLIVAWNDTAAGYPREATVVDLFEQHAARKPEATAALFEDESLSYRDLDARANRLARRLQELGVGAENVVGLCAERSLDMVVGVLGILKAGGAYVPLDASYPRERLAFMVEDARASVLVTQRHLTDRLPGGDARVVLLDEDLGRFSAEDLPRAAGPANLAYVIYTSGSTGRPKAALNTHRGLCNLATAGAARFGIDDSHRMLQVASFSFDASVWEMATALSKGASLQLVTRETLLSPEKLAETIERHGATTALFSPSLLGSLPVERLAGMHTLVAGGEACSRELAARWAPGRRFWNAYGPSEAAVVSSVHRVEGDPGRPPPIGKPVPNARLYVLDEQQEPVPQGVPGELYVGGDGVGRGYLRRPSLTAERFVPDPFGGEPGARLYRTGDRVRFLADGSVEFLGRLDHQVKVRGFRIELGEIESALAQHDAVREVVVVARDDPNRLVAYYVARGEVRTAALRAFLAERLPEYMVPSAFVSLDRLPLSPNGKVDRGALPAPGSDRAAAGTDYLAPRTPIEEVLAAVFADVLGLDEVSVHDDFFELGGHSLLATQLASRVQKALGAELPLRAVFEAPTVAGLAARVEMGRGGAPTGPIARAPRDGELPLSFAQQRLWFLDRLDPHGASYAIPAALRLEGELDVPALRAALDEIVRRHEALRTTFAEGEGGPVQEISPQAPLDFPLVDLTGLPERDREKRVAEETAREAAQPFDLAQGPLLRARLLHLGPEEHVALFTMHHIVSDGWSVGVFVRELAALYESFHEGRPSQLPELPIQYADFASWQRGHLSADRLDAQLRYWKEKLAPPLARLELPTDRPRPAFQTFRGAAHRFRLSKELTRSLEELSRAQGATIFMTLLAGFEALLHRITGQTDLCVGSPIASRNRAELEPLIGFFVNTLVLRTDLAGDPAFLELLGRVRETALDAYAHQEVPFERLVDELQPVRDLSHTPLFQVVFALHNAPSPELRLEKLALTPIAVDGGTSKFDLTVGAFKAGDEIACSMEFNTDLFDRSTVERLAKNFTALLESAAAHPQERIGELAMLSADEREQLLVTWNDSSAEYPRNATVVELFEEQVARRPEATAVLFEDERLSYGELNVRANRLAHRLQELGVGPESAVGLCAERSLDLIVGVLAILKAGGAYVPLDASYPPERLAFLLDDARISVVLAQRHLEARFGGARHTVTFDEDLGDSSPHDLPRDTGPNHLAYVLYTSGSTGRPKGVGVHHRAIARLVKNNVFAEFGPEHRILQAGPLAFDASTFEIWGSLLNGGAVALLPPETPTPELIGAAIRRHGVDTLFLTAALAHLIADECPHVLDGVRQLLVGGDAVSSEHVERLRRALPGCSIIDGYGPTEVTTFSSYYPVSGDVTRYPAVPIGRPIANTRLYVLDERMQPLPQGVPGELYIGGDGVARGYLGRPALTGERFVPDPFGGDPGSRLYRTGDRVRWLPDGNVEYLGRLDHQVKVRGFRIELGEIEAALAQHDAVREVVVVAREEEGGNKRLVAYYVEAGEIAPSELRAFLGQRLPGYMVPSAFVALERMPLSPNGKIDRKALPAPDASRPEETAYLPPRTQAEEILAAIWAKVLGIEKVGIRDNFFELGGDSILSIQVISRARQHGLVLTPRQLFEHQTVEALAAAAELPAHGASAEQGIVTGPLPLTPIQAWFFEEDLADPHHFNQSVLLEVEPGFRADLLPPALSLLLRHHDALRLRFRREKSWTQEIAPSEAHDVVDLVDLSTLATADRRRALEEHAGALQRSLDLASGPLVRAAWYDHGRDAPGRLLLVVHHLAVDAVSWRILVDDLASAYAALVAGKAAELPPKTTSYRQWAGRLRAHAGSKELRRQLSFWTRLGSGYSAALPLDYPRGTNRVGSVRELRVSLSENETEKLLHDVPRVSRTQIDDALLAALGLALTRWTGHDRLLIDMERHGREPLFGDVDLSRTVGWFTSLFPVALDFRRVRSPWRALASVAGQLGRIPDKGIGYGVLRYLSDDPVAIAGLRSLPPRMLSFNYLGQLDAALPPGPFRLAVESAGTNHSERGVRDHVIDVVAMVRERRFEAIFLYSEEIHARGTIAAVARRFLGELRGIVGHATRTSFAAQAERASALPAEEGPAAH